MKKHVHLIGIGGIGISALAQLYVHQGYRVSGTNDNPSPETLDRVRALGVPVSLDISIAALPTDVDLFVYSDAWLSREPEFMASVRSLGVPTRSYFEALGDATREGTSIVVSGTHGKTTTTAMLGTILQALGKEPTIVAGSIMSGQGSNFVAGRPDLFVVEGCEYMRHFLHLHPNILIMTNIELDHTDYYKNIEDMQEAFNNIAHKVPHDGTIVTDTDAPSVVPVLHDTEAVVIPYQHMTVPSLKVPGAFNIMNARAAKAAAFAFDPEASEEVIDTALASFAGTWRRFEYKGTTSVGAVVYDDYAHHPTAVRHTLEMVRSEFSQKRLVVVFHPHLFSRTRDFMNEFASALCVADEVLLAPIYAAREEPISGVTSEALAGKIAAHGTPAAAFDSFESVLRKLATPEYLTPDTLVLTMGAGDVYHVADALVAPARPRGANRAV